MRKTKYFYVQFVHKGITHYSYVKQQPKQKVFNEELIRVYLMMNGANIDFIYEVDESEAKKYSRLITLIPSRRVSPNHNYEDALRRYYTLNTK